MQQDSISSGPTYLFLNAVIFSNLSLLTLNHWMAGDRDTTGQLTSQCTWFISPPQAVTKSLATISSLDITNLQELFPCNTTGSPMAGNDAPSTNKITSIMSNKRQVRCTLLIYPVYTGLQATGTCLQVYPVYTGFQATGTCLQVYSAYSWIRITGP